MLKTNLIIGLIFVVLALLLALVWIPLDVETAYFEKERRQIVIGDSLAPTLAAFFILFGGLLILAFERVKEDQSSLSFASLRFSAAILLIVLVSFALMRWAGPALVWSANLFLSEDLSYRLLRDTVPWKFVGFFLGGGFLIASLISMVAGKVTVKTILIAATAIIVMILIYDLPFEDLLLPPNGDV